MTNVAKNRIASFVRLLCALVSTGATMLGISLDAGELETVAGIVVALVAIVVAWWMDNCVTKKANESKELFAIIKNNDTVRAMPEDLEDLGD